VTRLWLALLLCLAVPARADWEVKRSPFDARLVTRYKALLDKDPFDAYAFRQLFDMYKRYRTVDALVAEYAKAPSTASTEAVRALLAKQRGQLDEAERRLQASLALHADPRAQALLGDVLFAAKKPGEAEAAFKAALDGTKDAARKPILQKLAQLALRAERGVAAADALAEARRYYDELLKLAPNDNDIRREYAEVLAARGVPKDAAAEWSKLAARAKDPVERAQAEVRAGELLDAAGQETEAVALFERVFAAMPRGNYLRREVADRIIGVARKKDQRRELTMRWDKQWTSRDFVQWEAMARLWDELGDAERAIECWRHALDLDRHAIEARRRLIALYERAGRDADALAESRKLVTAAPGEWRFQLDLAERLRRSTEHGAGEEALKIAARVSASSRDPSLHVALADLYMHWGLQDKVLAERQRLVELEPNEELHIVNLGESLWQRGQKDKAIEVWRRLANLGGKKEAAMAKLAEVYADHDMLAESFDLYERALKLAPTDLALKRGRAAALERLRRDDEADRAWLEVFELATARSEKSVQVEARQRLLTLWVRKDRLRERVTDTTRRFERAMTGSDENAKIAWGLLLAEAAARHHQTHVAEEVLGRLVKASARPEVKADALVALAHVRRQRRQIREAIDALQQAAQLVPARARELYAQIAELSLQLYRDADALAYAEKATALGPPDANAQIRLGEVLERREQIAEAAAAYKKAIEIDERQWRTYFTLARLELRRGRPEEAARLYREVLRRAPDEELVIDAARRAIDLEEFLGRLGELERELQPLAYTQADKKVYRQLLVELYERYAVPLAARARRGDAAAKVELEHVGETALRPLLDVLVDGDSAQVRTAVRLLGELGNPGAAAPLLRLARPVAAAPSPVEKRAARQSKHEVWVPFVFAQPAAAPGAGVEVRIEAALGAARVASQRDRAAFVALAGDSEKHLRLAAMFALGRLGGAEAAAAAEKALGDGTADVQAMACVALGRMKAPRAGALLSRMLGDESRAPLVRAAAAIGLALAEVRGHEDDLNAALISGSDELGRAAAWALGRLGGASARGALASAVFLRREDVRRVAIAALRDGPGAARNLPEPERGPGVGDGLSARNWLAALVVTPAGNRSDAAPLFRGLESATSAALGDALTRHRDLQLRALADLDARDDGPALGPLSEGPLSSADQRTVAGLVAALLPTIDRAFDRGDVTTRVLCVQVLGKIPGGLSRLIAAVDDPNEDVRLAAIAALGEPAGDTSERAVPLARVASSSSWRDRRAAALSYAALPASANPLAGLVRLLGDEDPLVREGAVHGLMTLGRRAAERDGAVRALSGRAAKEPVAEIRQAISHALATLQPDTDAAKPPAVR
jgi:tetratricopeptide (TPR) repeat protein